MKPETFLTLVIDYLTDYLITFFATLSKPRLLFAPMIIENEGIATSTENQKIRLNPKLLSYAAISLIIGVSIQSVIPSSDFEGHMGRACRWLFGRFPGGLGGQVCMGEVRSGLMDTA